VARAKARRCRREANREPPAEAPHQSKANYLFVLVVAFVEAELDVAGGVDVSVPVSLLGPQAVNNAVKAAIHKTFFIYFSFAQTLPTFPIFSNRCNHYLQVGVSLITNLATSTSYRVGKSVAYRFSNARTSFFIR
jgi:hypothetical protein